MFFRSTGNGSFFRSPLHAHHRSIHRMSWISPALISLMLLFVSAGPAMAEPLQDPSPEHNAIRGMRDEMLAALKKGDIDTILKHVDRRAVFTAMNGETVRGHDAIRSYFKRMMVGPESVVKSISLDMTVDELTTLYGGDTGIATGHSRDSYILRDGSSFTVSTRWTATMVKENGEWKLAAFQSSVNPFQNPILHRVEKFAKIFGGAGALLALLLGIGIGFRAGRRKPA